MKKKSHPRLSVWIVLATCLVLIGSILYLGSADLAPVPQPMEAHVNYAPAPQ